MFLKIQMNNKHTLKNTTKTTTINVKTQPNLFQTATPTHTLKVTSLRIKKQM